MSGSLALAVSASALRGDWDGFSIRNPWFWLEWTGYTVPPAWACIEALLAHRQARRRLRLGLCDALVCFRFLLWALFACCQVGISLVTLPQYADFEQQGVFVATWDLLVGLLEILSIGTIRLVFFEPVVFRRAVEPAAAAARREEG